MTARKQSMVNTGLGAFVALATSFNAVELKFLLDKADAMNTRSIRSEQQLVEHEHHFNLNDSQIADLQRVRSLNSSTKSTVAINPSYQTP